MTCELEREMEERIAEAARTIAGAGALAPRLREAAEAVAGALREGRGVFLFGNGGSAADAQHVAGELVGRFQRERPALRAMALTTDSSVLTSLANDYGYDMVFARQLEALAGPGDVAIALSTSGCSPNIIKALETARRLRMQTIVFTGPGGGGCACLAGILLDAPGATTAHVQEVHAVLYHTLCEYVERVCSNPA